MVPLLFEAGPDAGRALALSPGRTVLGRATGWCDPLVEPHHLLVDTGPVGAGPTVTQLAGRHPALVDGEPLVGPRTLGPGAVLEVGASRVVVGRAPVAATPVRATVVVPDAGVDATPLRTLLTDAITAVPPLVHRSTVVLGVGRTRHRVTLVDRTGRNIPIGTLTPVAQAAFEQATHVDGAITVDIGPGTRVGFVADDPWPVLRSVIGQLAIRGRWQVRWELAGAEAHDLSLAAGIGDVADPWGDDHLLVCDAAAWRSIRHRPPDVPVVIVGARSAPGTTHRITVGSRWRATLETSGDPDRTRFHAAGWSAATLRKRIPGGHRDHADDGAAAARRPAFRRPSPGTAARAR